MQGREEQRNHEQGTRPKSCQTAMLPGPVPQLLGIGPVRIVLTSILDPRTYPFSFQEHCSLSPSSVLRPKIINVLAALLGTLSSSRDLPLSD